MESRNKEEAIKAKEIALEKMENKDFTGARKFAVRAQQLSPDLENVEQIILVCDVHISAAERASEDQKDWYKILNIEPTADEASVRKQYNRMALSLHPDKNRFPGAADAFHLILEAKAVLTDNEKRSLYDSRCKAKVLGEWGNSNCGFARFQNNQQNQQQTDQHISNNLPNGRGSNWDYGFSRFQNNHKHQQQSSNDLPNRRGPNWHYGFSRFQNNQADQPSSKNWPNCRGSKQNKSNKPSKFEGSTRSSKKNVAASEGRDGANNKGRKVIGDGDDEVESVHTVKRSKHSGSFNVAAKEVDTKSKRTAKSASKSEENGKRAEGSKSSRDHSLQNGKTRTAKERGKHGASVEDGRDSEKTSQFPVKSASGIAPDSKNLEYSDGEFNDFEKERDKKCFNAGQIWAVYDTLDAMPRFYALINKVISEDFKLQITWLEPLPNNEEEKKWLYQGLPASCGKFKLGHTETIEDHAIFSHLVNWKKNDAILGNIYEIYPRKGEIWAIFKGWDMNWYRDPQSHKVYELELVEILSDYYCELGVYVTFLGKIKDFSSSFSRLIGKGVGWKVIPVKDRFRFSHKIPSFPMTTNEGPNGVKSFFELDPASLPSCEQE